MIKRFLCLLAVLLLCSTALAEPRYPTQGGVATDKAAVMSVQVLEDLRTLDKRLDKADMPRLYIVTVDFLDGADVQSYADALFQRWNLDDDELLLLIAVGEESYAIASGKNVDRLVSRETQQKLLTSLFREPFLNQQYDAAIAAFVPAMVAEMSKACGEHIKTEDLFRNASSSLIVNWANTMPVTSADPYESFSITREHKSSGFSLLTVIIIVALLLLIFGTFRKSRGGRPGKKNGKEPEVGPDGRPVYFKPRQKSETPQYFKPRSPR